ncbi:hypothetical protein GCM10010198_12290 [Nocardia seriolae]
MPNADGSQPRAEGPGGGGAMLFNIAGGGFQDILFTLLKAMCTASSGGAGCAGWGA